MLSRVAENLYWVSRYLERTEHTTRLLDLTLNILLEQRSEKTVARITNRLLDSLCVTRLPEGAGLYALTNALAFDQTNHASIVSCLTRARENARQIREQISSEMWEHLNTLYHQIRNTSIEDVWQSQTTHGFFRNVKEGIQLFHGITDSTLSHNEGWQFLQAGRYIERANSLACLLDVQFADLRKSSSYPKIALDYLDWVGLLKSCTAFEAYCKVYTADLHPERIIEFLLLNSEFPHSICFSVNQVDAALNGICKHTSSSRSETLNHLIGKLKTTLCNGKVVEIMNGGLSAYLKDVQTQCTEVHNAIYDAYLAYPIETAMYA